MEILRWQDIAGERFETVLQIVKQEFDSNGEFRCELLAFIEKYTRRRKALSDEKKLSLANYLLYELPTLLDGIHHGGINSDLILYPTYVHSGMSELVRDIQAGRRFENLWRKLPKKKTIMVEALIPELTVINDDVSPSVARTYRKFGLTEP